MAFGLGIEERALIILGRSTTPTQEPSTVDTPIQIDFGPEQTSDHLDLSAAGTLTVKVAGTYHFAAVLPVGRSGSAGTSVIFMRMVLNGVQVGGSLYARISNANETIPLTFTTFLPLSVGDELVVQLVRDSAGHNSGGLQLSQPTLAGWDASGSAVLAISR